MSPFVRTPKQFLITGLLWSPVCFWVIFVLVSMQNLSWWQATVWSLPPMLLELFICLSSYFLCRITMNYGWHFTRIAWTHLVSALLLTGAWLLLIMLYTQLIEEVFLDGQWQIRFAEALPVFIAVGLSLYFMAALVHYLMLAVERNKLVEQEALKQKILAGEAELRALKATVHPHFLFNSLNVLGPLMSHSVDRARSVVSQLSDFLLYSLRYGKRETVTVGDEVEHIRNYLGIESVRLAERLNIEWDIDDQALNVLILPLTLLPLVENAIKHGINQCLEGGTLRISVKKEGIMVSIVIENPWEAPTRRPRGEGMGLQTLKQRIRTYYGDDAHVSTQKDETMFRVTIKIPLGGVR